MKKLLIALLAAAGLYSGVMAEGTGTKYTAGNYNIYKSSDAISSTSGQTVRSAPAILHKVIISSAATGVDVSTNAVFKIYDNTGANVLLKAEVNLSTQSVPAGVTEYTFDMVMSTGIRTSYAGSTTTAKVNLIYRRPSPASAQGDRVWSSSYTAANTNVQQLAAGPVLLHKIIVLTKGTGTAILSVYDSRATSPSASARIAGIDLTDSAREYNYDVYCSSGLSIQSSGTGTVVPGLIVLYKKNPSKDYEVWKSSFTTGTVTTSKIVTGSGYVFGGVVNGDSVSGSSLTVYDSSGSANGLIAALDGGASFDRRMYDVGVSSGITYSSSGAGLFSILYKRHND